MPQINSIRDLANNKYSVAEIARELHYDEKNVRKYLNQQNFSPEPPITKVFSSKLDPYKSTIDKWLETDKNQWFKQRHTAQIFQRIRAHYGFSVRFCNPYSGHEKGNVETKVGYIRRNIFVPVPHYEDVVIYNQSLLEEHITKAKQEHYKKGITIENLFREDQKALHPLPRIPFDVCRYEYMKTDG